MAFAVAPLIPGDLYEAAAKLAATADREVVRHASPAERAAVLARCWDEIASLGWPALFLPEDWGGAGGSVADLAALLDGAARDALALPLAAVCALVPVLLRAANPARAAAIGADVAVGNATLCPVLDTFQRADPPRATLDVDGSLRLDGTVSGVETPLHPTHYLLACPVHEANGQGEPGLLLIPAEVLPQAPRRFERLDGRTSADLDFRGLSAPSTTLLARGPSVTEQVDAALRLGTFLTCVEVVSTLGAALERTVSYLSTRVQFGVPLSSFQALRHRAAELYLTYETGRALVQHLLQRTGATEPPPWRDVALAKLRLGLAAREAAEAMIQLHGGMGMTQELPASRLNKRLLMAEFDYGDTAWHARRLLASS